MNTPLELRDLPLASSHFREKAALFLEANGLTLPCDIEYMATLVDDCERIMATAALGGNVIKCVAVSPELRGEDAASRVVTQVVNKAFSKGVENLFVFTKPEFRKIFPGLGFKELTRADDSVLLHSNPAILDDFTRRLASLRKEGTRAGAVVMHANPPTLGHKFLIDTARRQCDHLFIILLEDNPSTFIPLAERMAILRKMVGPDNGITIISGGEYTISAATFPDYFIKEVSTRTKAYAQTDAQIFARFIAPALGVTVRFLGTEPTDPLTSVYNSVLLETLPPHGIDVRVIDRLESEPGLPVSASRLRSFLSGGKISEAAAMVHPCARPALLASLACRALRGELELTPKPGLVDKAGNGAHTDMDYQLMLRSIESLYPAFVKIAEAGYSLLPPPAEELQALGREAEQLMLLATGGVNTHRGAIFSLGLAVAAAAHLLRSGNSVTQASMQEVIAGMASGITPAEGTNGATASDAYGINGARGLAMSGYRQLYESWLPELRRQRGHRPEEEARAITFLKIMTEISDTNLYHRGGRQGATLAAERAGEILSAFSMRRMAEFDSELCRLNLSPGGSADMLALTLLNDNLIEHNNLI